MHQIYPDQGLLYLLDQMAKGSGTGLYWQLYSTNTIPTLADLLAAYMPFPAAWSRIQVADAAFTLKQVAANVGSIQAPNIVFVNTTVSPQTVYGYVIIDDSLTKLVASARFDTAPIVIPIGGNQTVTPILGDYSQFSS
jgi:hypothetical protein